MAAATDTLSRSDIRYARRARIESLALLALTIVVCLAVGFAQAGPNSVRLRSDVGRIVPIPASVPHEAGDMVDSRIVPDLRWIAARFPIYITDGYSGPAAERRVRRVPPLPHQGLRPLQRRRRRHRAA